MEVNNIVLVLVVEHANALRTDGKLMLGNAIKQIADAYNRQISKTIIVSESPSIRIPLCPTCGCVQDRLLSPYCPDCGQKLDWADTVDPKTGKIKKDNIGSFKIRESKTGRMNDTDYNG
jgi:hypothetical protein